MAKRNGTPIPNTQGSYISAIENLRKGKDKCTTPNLTDSEIKHKFIEAYNITMQDKKRIIDDTNAMIALLTDTTQLDNQIDDLYDEMVVTTELINKLIKDNSKSNMDQDEYDKKYMELTKRYEQTIVKKNS